MVPRWKMALGNSWYKDHLKSYKGCRHKTSPFVKAINLQGFLWHTDHLPQIGKRRRGVSFKPWHQAELVDTRFDVPATNKEFIFEKPVEIQFLRFDLVSYWGEHGGSLQYFGPILGTPPAGDSSKILVLQKFGLALISCYRNT